MYLHRMHGLWRDFEQELHYKLVQDFEHKYCHQNDMHHIGIKCVDVGSMFMMSDTNMPALSVLSAHLML